MQKFLYIFLGILVVGLGFFIYTQTSVVTVFIYDDHFEPQTTTIAVGTTIRFISKTNKETWPASNEHPSHGIYPEFDTQQPLQPYKKWDFHFDKPGIWDFHDHMNSGNTGTIIVQGAFGDAAQACASSKKGISRATCWESDFAHSIETEGFDGAFKKFATFYEEDDSFRSYCHDIMHYVGRAAYDVYALDAQIIDRPETSYCGYGFYHGFIESSLESEGSTGLETTKQY